MGEEGPRESSGSRGSITTIFNPGTTTNNKTAGKRGSVGGVGQISKTPSIVVTDDSAATTPTGRPKKEPAPRGKGHHHGPAGGADAEQGHTTRQPAPPLANGPNSRTNTSLSLHAHMDGDPSANRTANNAGTPSSVDSASDKLQRLQKLKKVIVSHKTRKMVCGVVVTGCVAASWVGATHAVKRTYLLQVPMQLTAPNTSTAASKQIARMEQLYDAPFLTTWLSTLWTGLFFPLYFIFRVTFRSEKTSVASILKSSVQGFRDRGFTLVQFLWRCAFFCVLWVVTNYLYVHSLRILQCTAVMALFATNVSFVYLLAWVVLHEQFVGIRIVAVILSNTGIALMAYMDGITRSKTLGGVVLAAAAAAGSAVYKVLFKKMLGEATFGQVALVFSLLGLLAAIFLWPICLLLTLTGLELVQWTNLPWPELLLTGGLSLLANLLGNFGVAITYEVFITLGLIVAVPVSGILDARWYGVTFEGMFLAGIILVACGFFLVLLPANWPDYITKVLRAVALLRHRSRWRRGHPGEDHSKVSEQVDYRTGHIRSHLRSPSGRVR